MSPETTTAASGARTPAPAARPAGRLLPGLDNRFLPPVLITCILITAHFTFGILEAYERTAVAIVTAIGAELVVGRLTYGRWPHPASAYITGISVGILVRSPFLWPYFLASLISILTKYVLRLHGRHLWNPSNFGVSAVLFLAPATVTLLSIQWGNNIWPMAVIWLLGFAIVWRVGKLHISASYIVAFVVFALARSAITGNPWQATVAPITGPMYQLFIFFMVTDPKTTVRSRRGQVIVVVAVAFVEMLLRLAEVIYAPFYALFLVGPAALLIEHWMRRDDRLGGDGVSQGGSMRRVFVTGIVLFTAVVAGAMALGQRSQATQVVEVFKTPTCGCCSLWVEHLKASGFTTKVTDLTNLSPVKAQHQVPGNLQSCHTAVVDGYVIEGHVPAADIQRLLKERPNVAGLAVPGMPAGSPGMEAGGRVDRYDVVSFTDDGKTAVFASYPR